MGAVYKARQKSLKRWVAIKLLPLVAADDELKFAERFRNEAETMAQMKELDQARGLDFDRLFLQFMIQHHRGAVTMVKELFATDGAGQNETVFKFASDVNTDQTTEIARMERMLATILFEKRAP